MTETIAFHIAGEAELAHLAQLLAAKVRAGDTIALHGDLGAGKTTFARTFVRAVLADPAADVPSPTFSLLQSYESPRFPVHHFDLYRLSDPDELVEIGLDDALRDGVCLIEWPERAGPHLPPDTITIAIAETAAMDESRDVSVTIPAALAPRIGRVAPLRDLLIATYGSHPPAQLSVSYLQGDASARAYLRLSGLFGRRIMMDFPQQPDGPPIANGLPYSRLAHLAENITPYLAIGDTLRRAGFSAPVCFAADAANGTAIIEDLGDALFADHARLPVSQHDLWQAATGTLLALHAVDWPAVATSDKGLEHRLPHYVRAAFDIELSLLGDWFVPWATGGPLPEDAAREFKTLWAGTFDLLDHERADGAPTWVQRDFHSPNLLWLGGRTPPANVGLIDFQDALIGHRAYDLVSLLQDARVDVPEPLEAELLAHYIRESRRCDAHFDEAAFRRAYAILGAQRNTKILGIFARLAVRDGKPGYTRHIPRIRRYLARDLDHDALSALKRWYESHLPPAA